MSPQRRRNFWQEWAGRGERVILVRRETTPDDYHGMIAAQGILTSAGGTNSHAAVVARGEGIPAVCGADTIKLNVAAKTFTARAGYRIWQPEWRHSSISPSPAARWPRS